MYVACEYVLVCKVRGNSHFHQRNPLLKTVFSKQGRVPLGANCEIVYLGGFVV